MTYKQDVVDAAIQGLIAGGMSDTEANIYRLLLEKVYDTGYNEAIRTARPYQPVISTQDCPVCGLGKDGKSMGYVCSNSNCPTRITCT